MTSAVASGGQSEIPEGWQNHGKIEVFSLGNEQKDVENLWFVKKFIYKFLIYVDVRQKTTEKPWVNGLVKGKVYG
jgi:hypothetical protein